MSSSISSYNNSLYQAFDHAGSNIFRYSTPPQNKTITEALPGTLKLYRKFCERQIDNLFSYNPEQTNYRRSRQERMDLLLRKNGFYSKHNAVALTSPTYTKKEKDCVRKYSVDYIKAVSGIFRNNEKTNLLVRLLLPNLSKIKEQIKERYKNDYYSPERFFELQKQNEIMKEKYREKVNVFCSFFPDFLTAVLITSKASLFLYDIDTDDLLEGSSDVFSYRKLTTNTNYMLNSGFFIGSFFMQFLRKSFPINENGIFLGSFCWMANRCLHEIFRDRSEISVRSKVKNPILKLQTFFLGNIIYLLASKSIADLFAGSVLFRNSYQGLTKLLLKVPLCNIMFLFLRVFTLSAIHLGRIKESGFSFLKLKNDITQLFMKEGITQLFMKKNLPLLGLGTISGIALPIIFNLAGNVFVRLTF